MTLDPANPNYDPIQILTEYLKHTKYNITQGQHTLNIHELTQFLKHYQLQINYPKPPTTPDPNTQLDHQIITDLINFTFATHDITTELNQLLQIWLELNLIKISSYTITGGLVPHTITTYEFTQRPWTN